MRVYCYRNLHKPGVIWSIRDCKTGRVIDWQPVVLLKNVTFCVGNSGRLRVIREKRKNVHAGVRGERLTLDLIPEKEWTRVTYSPYRDLSFIRYGDGSPIFKAEFCILKEDGCWAIA